MKLTIEREITETETDWPLLECKTESGGFITVDPFMFNALNGDEEVEDMTWKAYVQTLIGRHFNMSHFHVSQGVYYCEFFDEVE